MSSKFYKYIKDELTNFEFQILDSNLKKPWSAYFCIDEHQVQKYSDKFFNGIELDSLKIENELKNYIPDDQIRLKQG